VFSIKHIILFFITCIVFTSCIETEHFENNPRGNFDALWKIMDQRYCFFEYKNVDWDSVYVEYSKRVTDNMGKDSLFYLMNEMLQELKDGHVNLYSPFDIGRYWKWFEDYAPNFHPQLVEEYLKTDYMIAGGIKYKVLPEDSIGYMYYGDFSSGLGELNLDYIIYRFWNCPGIIIDVRDNGGGMLSNVEKLASRFFEKKTLTGYIQHKTGTGHNDFSKPFAKYIEPSPYLRYKKPVVILTNRRCYSATNDFVNSMRYAPNVTIMGDRTGGGGGLPFSSELPNGWSVRLSACPSFNASMEQIEFGIEPDIYARLDEKLALQGFDSMIDEARIFLIKKSKSGKSFGN
jgi:hypothetical protein